MLVFSPIRPLHRALRAALFVCVLSIVPAMARGQAVAPPAPLSQTAIPSPPTPAAWASVAVPVAPCTVAPVIDGRLDDPCWKTATHVSGFYRFAGTAPIVAGNQTEAWICADKTHLYVAFHCLSSAPVRASETMRNGDITHDDFVGIDIDSQDTHRDLSTFEVNAKGTQNEVLEGGTAQNITWAGDWVAAARKTPDGYTVEMSIPFALMRYPKGATSFGFLLYRQLAGEVSLEGWPYVPLVGANNQSEALYMAQATHIDPLFFRPQPIFLPYTLASAGEGSSVRTGIDIKAPISSTLTGVATVNPDFETIEQDVASINFSYTPKLLTDQRPFFAEGASFLPAQDLFYSRQIGQIDTGVKLVGKQQNTTIGLLSTDSTGDGSEGTFALNLQQDLSPLSDLGIQYTSDSQQGLLSNRVGRLFGGYGWKDAGEDYTLSAFHTQSYVGGRQANGADSVSFSNPNTQVNRPYFNLQWLDIGPNFVSDLGYVPEVDKRGPAMTFGQTTIYNGGRWSLSNIELDADDYQHHTEGFFHSDASLSMYALTRSGWSFTLVPTIGQYQEFHDSTGQMQLGWGKTTLFQQGYAGDSFGRLDGQRYNFVQLGQGLLVSRPVNVQVAYSRLLLGSTITTQTIITGAYRLTSMQTVGGRLVEQGGEANLYLSFGQQVRKGTDIFVLFGDPNSASTRGRVAVKLVQPF